MATLERETMTTKENAVCTLIQLSQNREEEKVMIGKAGVISHLVKLLEGGDCMGRRTQ